MKIALTPRSERSAHRREDRERRGPVENRRGDRRAHVFGFARQRERECSRERSAARRRLQRAVAAFVQMQDVLRNVSQQHG